MKTYSFDPNTKEWTSEANASIDPLETIRVKQENPQAPPVYLLPAHATFVAPPLWAEKHIPVFNEETNTWSIVKDHRGEEWYEAYGKKVIVDRLGDPTSFDPPLLPEEPPIPLDLAKALKMREIDGKCKATIVGDVLSDALGSNHLYPNHPEAQRNMIASVLDALRAGIANDAGFTTPFWCKEATTDGEWAFRPHTAQEISKAGQDLKNWIVAAQYKNAQLVAQVLAAATVEEVQAISWDN